jgi:hypothetical protein
VKLIKNDIAPEFHLYCVDGPDRSTYVSRNYSDALRFLANRLGKPMDQVTVKMARDGGYTIRRV